MLKAIENTAYFRFTREVHSVAEFDDLLQSGKVLFGVEIPRGFERAVRRGDRPALLVAADATDPTAAGSALGALSALVQTALEHDLHAGNAPAAQFEIRTHARYNPAASSRLNIVPGLVGTILTMTMLIFTALSVTREIERGTMESLLSMPIKPVEVMFGKIIPYVIVGIVQATLIVGIGVLLFGVPILGSIALLALLTTLFITVNLAIGYTFSTIVQNQLQAMQLSMMFFLPSILLSGFMFPFAGMPVWAQYIGEGLPLTHYVRIVRAIMLKGATIQNLQYDTIALDCADAAGDDDRCDALPSHARLMQYPSSGRSDREIAIDAGAVGKQERGIGGLRRISACADAAGDAHRADPGQGADRDHRRCSRS